MGRPRQLEEFKVSLSEEVQELRLTLTRINEASFMAQSQLPGLQHEQAEFTHKIGVLEFHIQSMEDSIDQAEP